MKSAFIYIFILLVCAFTPSVGQIVTVKAEFNKDSVNLGEQLNYTITANAGKDVFLKFPEYSDTISGEIEIIDVLGRDTIIDNDRVQIKASYKVVSFSPGWNTIPPQPVFFRSGDLADTVYTTALLLTVLSPEIDTTQAFKPIKPPLNAPVNFAELWPWLAGGIVLVAAIFLIIYYVRRYYRRLRNQDAIEEVPSDPPHLEAYRALDRLRHEKLYQQGQVKDFYTRLTQIIRRYITRQFGFHALESTTQEILDAFRIQNAESKDLNKMLEELLMLADLVKFAKEDPLMKENEMHFTNAEIFIERTYRMFEDNEEGAKSDLEDGEENDVEQVRMEEK